MSDHRHATDRVKTIVISECPNGCDFGFEIECEGKESSVEELVETAGSVYDSCGKCGADMGTVSKTEPTEVLE